MGKSGALPVRLAPRLGGATAENPRAAAPPGRSFVAPLPAGSASQSQLLKGELWASGAGPLVRPLPVEQSPS
jgi:hypothetical protein